MSCELSSLLVAYVHDELSVTESRLVEAHVHDCAACATQLAEEASVVDAMMSLATALDEEPALVEVAAASRRRRWWPRLAWPSVIASAALVLVMCDQAAMRGPADVLAGPNASMTVARTPVDDTRPECEEPTWLGSDALTEGPVCDEPAMALALASFPPEATSDWDDEPDVCLPDDGGDLVCMPDEEPV